MISIYIQPTTLKWGGSEWKSWQPLSPNERARRWNGPTLPPAGRTPSSEHSRTEPARHGSGPHCCWSSEQCGVAPAKWCNNSAKRQRVGEGKSKEKHILLQMLGGPKPLILENDFCNLSRCVFLPEQVVALRPFSQGCSWRRRKGIFSQKKKKKKGKANPEEQYLNRLNGEMLCLIGFSERKDRLHAPCTNLKYSSSFEPARRSPAAKHGPGWVK